MRRGCLFQSTTDSEVFIHLIAISLYSTVVDRLIAAVDVAVYAVDGVITQVGPSDALPDQADELIDANGQVRPVWRRLPTTA